MSLNSISTNLKYETGILKALHQDIVSSMLMMTLVLKFGS